MALLHGIALRDHLRSQPLADPLAWASTWAARTAGTVEPFYRETVRADRHRLGQIEAAIQGNAYECDDPTFHFSEALPAAATQDPDTMRAWLDIFMLHRLVEEVMADEVLVDRVLANGGAAEAAPGLTRPQLEQVLG